jgi:hypothetical protein
VNRAATGKTGIAEIPRVANREDYFVIRIVKSAVAGEILVSFRIHPLTGLRMRTGGARTSFRRGSPNSPEIANGDVQREKIVDQGDKREEQ